MYFDLAAKRQMDYKPLWRAIPFKKSSGEFFGTGFSPLGPVLICINFNRVQTRKTFLLEQIEENDRWAHDFLSTTQNDRN